VYLSFYDLGKTDYFAQVLPELTIKSRTGVVIVDIHVSFMVSVYPGEQVAVQTSVVEIGNKSFKMRQQLIDTVTAEVKCVCETVMVCFNAVEKSSCQVPDEWRKVIAEFEENQELLIVHEHSN
jgi:acyl-CoA thioester hydrolase